VSTRTLRISLSSYSVLVQLRTCNSTLSKHKSPKCSSRLKSLRTRIEEKEMPLSFKTWRHKNNLPPLSKVVNSYPRLSPSMPHLLRLRSRMHPRRRIAKIPLYHPNSPRPPSHRPTKLSRESRWSEAIWIAVDTELEVAKMPSRNSWSRNQRLRDANDRQPISSGVAVWPCNTIESIRNDQC